MPLMTMVSSSVQLLLSSIREEAELRIKVGAHQLESLRGEY
jgi:hypothetical protein